jgi:hypothetical protein
MLTGCPYSTQPKKVSLPKVSEQARTDCGQLQEFKTGTKSEIIFVVADTADKFHECKIKHKTVVEEYKNLEKAVKEFNKGL